MAGWLSAAELAGLELPGLPGRRENAARWIARAGATEPGLVRPRKGKGGGLEISFAALPEAAREELRRRELLAVREAARGEQDLANAVEADKRQIALRCAPDLTARQRQVMDARAMLLMTLDREALVDRRGKKGAIARLQVALADGSAEAWMVRLVEQANDRTTATRTISRATIFAWFKAREERGPIALAPQPSREAGDLPPWFDGFLKVYSRPSKPSVAEALREYGRTLPPGAPRPSEAQALRALKKLPRLERLRSREGKLALRARQAYVARDFADLLPTSVYAADGKTFDAEVAHPIHGQPFRPELTTVIDVATRRVVGWSAALDESTFAVVDALRRACAFGGVPALFYTDRGPGYRNKAMDAPLTGFMTRAGITPMKALPYNSQAKGVVEKLNQVYTATAKRFATYIGRDMDKEAKLVVFKATRRELAVTGTSRLLPGWDAFLDEVQSTIDGYNDRPHTGLPQVFDRQLSRKRHMTPNELWTLKCEGFEPLVPTAEELDDMFRPYVVRRTRRALVDWLGNSYFHAALEAHDGRDVVVGYDIRDAARVWVREIDEADGERVPGRLICVAAFEGHRTRYVPVSAERAAMEKRARGRLARLQRKIDAANQELRPAALLDQQPPSRSSAPLAQTPPAVEAAPVPLHAGRPFFRDDVSFARWIVDHPGEATASDVALVVELITTPSTQELLRMAGVDLEALRSIARSARQTGAA